MVSALRATVLALCKYDALNEPPGKIKELRGLNFLLYSSIHFSSFITCLFVILRGLNFGFDIIGVAKSAPKSNKSFWISAIIFIFFLK